MSPDMKNAPHLDGMRGVLLFDVPPEGMHPGMQLSQHSVRSKGLEPPTF